jgi:spore maturation protein CgeB
MTEKPLRIVVCGLSITSSWGNGHAVTYRGLVRELARRGHDVLFLERDVPWYADNRDDPEPEGCRTELYRSRQELERRFGTAVREADAVVVGSYVPEGVPVARWVTEVARGVTAFYDIDTPVTLARLERGDHEYLSPDLVPRFDLYLSFTGGPTLERLEKRFGARRALPLYCSVDPERYRPVEGPVHWDLGYLGTYSPDRQPTLERLLTEVARIAPRRRFIVAGPGYPAETRWPRNVERRDHIAPGDHPAFYGAQRFTLNVTRADMVRAGWSPSIRLFEAAACGVPVISDVWDGIGDFFAPGTEILLARGPEDVRAMLLDMDETERRAIGEAARRRTLEAHTAAHRAAQLEGYLRGRTEQPRSTMEAAPAAASAPPRR